LPAGARNFGGAEKLGAGKTPVQPRLSLRSERVLYRFAAPTEGVSDRKLHLSGAGRHGSAFGVNFAVLGLGCTELWRSAKCAAA